MPSSGRVVKGGIFKEHFPHPLCEAERVDQRSVVGVSQKVGI